MFRNTFCPVKRLCFLAGKSHPTLLQGWLRDTGYPICYDLPLFATVCHYPRLFATIRTIWDYSHYAYYSLFIIRDYSLFTIQDYLLLTIRIFWTPLLQASTVWQLDDSGDTAVCQSLIMTLCQRINFFQLIFFSYFFHEVSTWSIWQLREILFFKIANLTLWYQTFAKNTVFNRLVRFFGCHDTK